MVFTWMFMLFILPTGGALANHCYYQYNPKDSGDVTLAVTVDTTERTFNLSIDNSPEEMFTCDAASLSCCAASINYNVTKRYVKVCGSNEMQIHVSFRNGTNYQAPGVDLLEKSYYNSCLRDNDENCSLIIGFVEEKSNVVFNFKDEHLLHDLRLDGEIVNSTSFEHILTDVIDHLKISCNCDLTGVHVTSNATISVFSSFYMNQGLRVLPLLPVYLWKSEFKLFSIAELEFNETVVIMTSKNSSYVKVSGYSTVFVASAGFPMIVDLKRNEHLEIKSSSPIYVIQYGYEDRSSLSYLISYPNIGSDKVCLGIDNTTSILQFVIPNANGTIEFHCNDNITRASNDVSVTMSGQQYLVSTTILNHTGCSVMTTGDVFGSIIIIGQNGLQVYAYGENVRDRIENYNFPSILYNTAVNDSKKDSYGNEFVILHPPFTLLKLFIACNGTGNAVIYNITLNREDEIDALTCNGSNQLEAVNFTTYTNFTQMYRINCTSLITVYVTGTTDQGLYAYLALPLNVLGYEYIAMSYMNTSFVGQQSSTCLISNVYKDTDLYIYLNDTSYSVFLDESVVQNGQRISLSDMEVVEITSYNFDLTGTYVRGNKPFQIVCGGYSDKSVFYEQLVPVIAWDLKYVVRDIESVNSFDKCIYRVMASDVNTDIVVQDEDGTVMVDRTLTIAEFIDLPSNELTIQSNMGIAVGLICCHNGSDVSFSVVPGNKQLMQLPSKSLLTDYFSDIRSIRKLVLYRDGSLIASHVGALMLSPKTCMLSNVNSNPLSTDGCFYSETQGSGCNCPNTSCCSFCDKNVVIISNETLQERIKQLVRELTIDKTTLSSYRNTKISADDQRVSSRGIGSGAAIILVTLVLLLVLSDTPLVVTQLKLLKQNISQGFRQFRGS